MIKSMGQMQEEMFSKCRFDGGYPRPVVFPLGVLAVAKDEEEYRRLMKEADALCKFALALAMVSAIAVMAFSIGFCIVGN